MKTSEKVVSAVLTIVLGILLVVLPNRIVEICMTVLGIVLIVSGILNLIDKMVMPAVVKIVVGALIILCGWVLVSAVLYIVAALLLIYGILQLYARIKLKVKGRESHRHRACLRGAHRLHRHRVFPVLQSGRNPSLGVYRGGYLHHHRGRFDAGKRI